MNEDVKKTFEPFQDRLSRDIRNDLSESLVKVLDTDDLQPALGVAEDYLKMDIAPYYKEYIEERVARYKHTLSVIREGTEDVFWRALVLWDHRLFFEMHEVLEHAWYSATGDEKQILQAMIRSAGVYIKLEHGYDEAARKIAGKAIPVLQEHKEYIASYFDPEILLNCLRNHDLPPPKLLMS